jgi:hypothetical protein
MLNCYMVWEKLFVKFCYPMNKDSRRNVPCPVIYPEMNCFVQFHFYLFHHYCPGPISIVLLPHYQKRLLAGLQLPY